MGNDQDLWTALVEAERQLARARAEFYQRAEGRSEVLAAALQGPSNWDRGTALAFLGKIPDDVPELLDQLVENATSHAWALVARRAIAAGRRELVTPLLRRIVRERLETADAEDYRRLAELLRHMNDDEALGELVRRAADLEDPDMQEVARDFAR
ncbi:hypothetical protein Afil01_43980 [Actinorhabdospora filicis]|uniref:Uncharacterized protein n=1 Tax=Actinorhabdospora filicis TaxID=1785913 RepID=A0A9W6SP63_9ACTN|nr:hypothetical protein [Actinorhabdospora filicis]GLZ79591.1 hypothetical protein Afil01_43980 [Actinorhabdospora filicis]